MHCNQMVIQKLGITPFSIEQQSPVPPTPNLICRTDKGSKGAGTPSLDLSEQAEFNCVSPISIKYRHPCKCPTIASIHRDPCDCYTGTRILRGL